MVEVAMRSMWSGTLPLNALFQVPISIAKATESYESRTALKQVSECCAKPFEREAKCPGCGSVRVSKKEGAKKGESTHMVMAVEAGPDDFRVIDESVLAEHVEAIKSDELEVLAVVPYGNAPLEFAYETYYVKADKKAKGADKMLDVVTAAIEGDGTDKRVIMVKWSARGRQSLGAIHYSPHEGVLVLNKVLFVAETRDVEGPFERDPDSAGEKEIELAGQLLDTFPDTFAWDEQEDESVALHEQAVANVLGGKKPKAAAKAAAPAAAGTPDVLAALQAAQSATKSPRGAKTKAAAPKTRGGAKKVRAKK